MISSFGDITMMAERRRSSWRDDVLSGLPEGFDYGNIRTVDDAESLIFQLPKSDRGKAARGLYEHRDQIGHQVAYAGMMTRCDDDDGVTVHAFETIDDFAAALRDVAPPLKISKPVRAWRGIWVVDGASGRRRDRTVVAPEPRYRMLRSPKRATSARTSRTSSSSSCNRPTTMSSARSAASSTSTRSTRSRAHPTIPRSPATSQGKASSRRC